MLRAGYLVRSRKGVALLLLIDAVLRLLPRRPVPAAPRRILVCNWAHIGDVLLSLPALAALRRLFPAAELGVLVGPAAAGVLAGTGLYDRLHVLDHPRLSRAPGGRLARLRRYRGQRRAMLHALRAARYEVAIDLYGYLPPAAPLLWQAGIPVRCGFSSAGFARLLTHPVAWQWHDRPMTALAGDLLRALWPQAAIGPLRPLYPGLPCPAPAAAPYLLLHPGAGAASRLWPQAQWRRLLLALAEQPLQLVLCGAGAQEAARVQRMAAMLPPGRAELAVDRPWRAFATLVAGAAGVVCLESATGHLAAAFGVPTVAIYTGTNAPRLWGPDNPRARVLVAPTGCAPCHRWGCAAMACVRDVAPADVLTALRELEVLRA